MLIQEEENRRSSNLNEKNYYQRLLLDEELSQNEVSFYEDKVKYFTQQITSNENNISLYQARLLDLQQKKNEQETKYDNTIADYELKKEEAISIRDELKEQLRMVGRDVPSIEEDGKNNRNKASLLLDEFVALDVFDRLGEVLFNGMAGDRVLLLLMLAMIIVLEVVLFITSDPMKRDISLQESLKNIIQYIEALMDVNGVRLNSDETISKKTGLPISECKRYKNILLNEKFRGQPLLTKGRGGSKTPFDKDNLIKIIKTRGLFD